MKNGKYLDSLSSDKKSRILKNIASHYGISVADAEDEVRDDDAEMLYEYIANDKSLQMEIYNDMERGKMAKGGNLQSVWNEYQENEDNNYHSENVVLLAKHFGTAEDLKEAKKILALHNKEGHLSSKNREKRDGLDKKLYPIAIAKMKAEGIKFAKGGKTKGKKEPMVVRSYFEDEAIDYAKGGSMESIMTDDIKQKFTEYRNKEGRKNFDAYEPILKEIKSENFGGRGYRPISGRSTEYNTLNLLKRLGVLTEVTDMRKPASKRGYYLKNNKMADGGMTTGWCYSIGGL